MIRFAGNVIEVKKLFPKAEKSQRFVKVSQMGIGSSMLISGLGKAVEMLASKLHGIWADNYRSGEMAKGNENPTRMKDDGMGGQVDILNTPFEQLPPKWQAENNAQAASAIMLFANDLEGAMGNIEGLTKEQLKNFIKARANDKMVELGYKAIYNDIDPNLLKQIEWFGHLTSGKTHQDFFAGRVTSYAKSTADWDDL